ncbi:MAG: hypothetical protein J6A16_07940 [Oscillospiraceae bacterium]|nr:hypothetical protein [Oscillospiraceae bacterium]
MTKKHESLMKAGVAGVVTGSLAFFAVNSLCARKSRRRAKRMTAAKTFKLIGNLMDTF